jgi:serine/threonine protein kinase
MPGDALIDDRRSICPDRRVLSDLSLGRITMVEIDRLATHVGRCSHCQSTMETFDNLEDSVVADLKGHVDLYKPNSDLELQIQQAELISRDVWPQPRSESSAPPERLGQYELLQQIGEGGMGTVWKALHLSLRRHVALKLLRESRLRDPDACVRFRREMEAVGRLDHPHLVRAHDTGEVNGHHFLAMEFLDGTDLSQWVRSHGPLRVSDACEIVRQAAVGLHHAHQHGLIHRDVKPSNLMLCRDGTVKVLDLGLARLLDLGQQSGELTEEGKIVGSGNFIAPEQILDTRTADARADVYSLGCTLYYLLTGKAPFSGPEFDTIGKKLLAHSQRSIPSVRERRPDVPDVLSSLLNRMLIKSPQQRVQTAQAVAEALAPLCLGNDLKRLATGELHETVVHSAVAPQSIHRRGQLLLALLGAGAVTLAAWNAQTLVMTLRDEGMLIASGDPGAIILTNEKSSNPITIEPDQRKGLRLTSGPYNVRFEEDPPTALSQPSRIMISRGRRTVVEIQRGPARSAPSAPLSQTGRNANALSQPLPAEIINSVGLRLRLIPAGGFVMGAPDMEPGRESLEGPLHRVQITHPFYMGVYEVTQSEFQHVMGHNPSRFQTANKDVPRLNVMDTKTFPMESIRWPDAVEFCEKLSALKDERHAGHVYRLPTEAEWEYACRSGTQTVFHFGDTLSPGEANFNTKFPYGGAIPHPILGRPMPVGSFKPNAWGLYDMHGNVWEWCQDWFDPDYYHHALSDDPRGPEKGSHHVLRGGGWGVRGDWCRSARRISGEMIPQLFYSIGFRVVCEVKVQSSEPQ